MANTSNPSKKPLGKLAGLLVVVVGVTLNTLGIVIRSRTDQETAGLILILTGISLMVCGIILLISKAAQNKKNIAENK